jgi:hypothetical protein
MQNGKIYPKGKKEKHSKLQSGVYIYLRGNAWILRYRFPLKKMVYGN